MNVAEQLALGVLCFGRALREAWRPATWLPWGLPLALQFAVLAALLWASHPLLSPMMAPLLRALVGEEALRYPQLFHRLAELSNRAGNVILLLAAPVAAGAATLVWADVFRGAPPRPAAALGSALRRAPALFVATLPGSLVLLAIAFGLEQLHTVRVSGLTRLAAPQAAAGVVLCAQAACLYAAPLVMLGGRSAFAAFTGLPQTWKPGFVPALVVLLLAGIPMLPVAWLEPLAAAGRWRALPEIAAAVAVMRALAMGLAGLLASGAATLAWLSAVAPRGDA